MPKNDTAPALAAADKTFDAPATAEEPAKFIILLDDFQDMRAGRVLKSSADLESALNAAKVKFRPATEDERRAGGCPE